MMELVAKEQPKLSCIANLFEALHGNGISYCNLKGNPQHLKLSFSGESDVDILFDPKQKADLEPVLARLGYKEFKAIKPKRLKDVVDFITLDERSGKVIHLHSYFALTIGEPYLRGYQVGVTDVILATRVFNEEFGTYCMAPAFELALLYLTEILKLRHRDYLRIYFKRKFLISEKVKLQYYWLKKNTTQTEVEESLRRIFHEYALPGDLIEDDLGAQLRKLAPLIKRESARYRIYSPPFALLLRWKRELSSRLLRKLSRFLPWPVFSMRTNPRGGTVVVLLGARDAGMPTVSGLLKGAFGKKMDVYKVSFGEEERISRNSRATLARITRALIIGWSVNSKLARIRFARKRGALVICDHFPQKALIDSKEGRTLNDLLNSKNPFVRAIARMESKLYNRATEDAPDLLLRLITAERTPETTRDQNGESKNDVFTAKSRTITVHTHHPLSEVVCVLKKEIWNIL